MSIFDIKNFERSGKTDNDIHLDNNDDTKEAINKITASALRTIKIFTPNLQRDIYDNEDFRENLLHFTRGNRHAQIQILVNNSSFAIQQGHRLIRLAQNITSAMQIRVTPEDYQATTMAFILVDQSELVFKADSNSKRALFSRCKHRSNKLIEFFTPAWEQAEIDTQIRRITV